MWQLVRTNYIGIMYPSEDVQHAYLRLFDILIVVRESHLICERCIAKAMTKTGEYLVSH
jgi:hypothetical protein